MVARANAYRSIVWLIGKGVEAQHVSPSRIVSSSLQAKSSEGIDPGMSIQDSGGMQCSGARGVVHSEDAATEWRGHHNMVDRAGPDRGLPTRISS